MSLDGEEVILGVQKPLMKFKKISFAIQTLDRATKNTGAYKVSFDEVYFLTFAVIVPWAYAALYF